MPPSLQFSSQIEAHEDRLQRMESTLQEVVAQVAGVSIKQELQLEKTELQTKYIFEKVEDIKGTMAKSLEYNNRLTEETHKAIKSLEPRIASLEDSRSTVSSVFGTIKRIALPIILGVSGAVAAKFGDNIWTWFAK